MKLRRVLRKELWFILILGLVAAGIIAAVGSGVSMYGIKTGSMEPTIPAGSRIITIPSDNIEVGDVIVFRGDNGHETAHRYVETAKDGSLITKGDANLTPDVLDRPLHKSDVIAKVVGQIVILAPGFWLSPRGAGIIALLALIVLLQWSMKDKDEVSELSDNTPVQEEALAR